MRAVSEARKLSMIEERRQDQRCLFQRGVYRHKGHNSKNLSWLRVLVEVVSVARKMITIEEWSQE
jgi:hypothetical protein